MRILVFALCAALAWALPARAQPQPSLAEGLLYDYLRHVVTQERYAMPLLSPSGRYLLVIQRADTPNNRDFALIFDLENSATHPVSRVSFGEYRVMSAQWVSDDYFILDTSGTVLLQRTEERGLRLDYSLPRARRTVSINRERAALQAELAFASRGSLHAYGDQIVDWLPDDPHHVLLSRYESGRRNLYRVNVEDGESAVVETGERETLAWYAIGGTARVRVDISNSGRSFVYFTRDGSNGRWRRTRSQRIRDVLNRDREMAWLGATDRPGEVYILTQPDEANTIGIYRFNFVEGELGEQVAAVENRDIQAGLVDQQGQLTGYLYSDIKPETVMLDDDWQAHMDALSTAFESDESVLPVSISGDRMSLIVTGPRTPGDIFVYDRSRTHVDFVTSVDPWLAQDRLRTMQVQDYVARDGTALRGYVSYPTSGPNDALPLVVLVHGGPEQRDVLGFDPVVQYLTGVGYAVFQPNFRGSGGFGRAFAQAGHREWDGRILSDIEDGVRSLIDAGAVDSGQVCIAGFSFGGYAALMGAALQSDLYKCAFAGAAPADLQALLSDARRADRNVYEHWVERIGDPRQDRDRIEAASPVLRAADMSIPVFLYHGEDDAIVPVSHSRDMERALRRAGGQVQYLERPGGLHDWGTERDFINTMQNLRGFLDDAIDGVVDSFEPQELDPQLSGSGPIRDGPF